MHLLQETLLSEGLQPQLKLMGTCEYAQIDRAAISETLFPSQQSHPVPFRHCLFSLVPLVFTDLVFLGPTMLLAVERQ